MMELLREQFGVDHNTPEIIRVSYDMQSGSYIDAAKQDPLHYERYVKALADVLDPLACDTIMEIGCGEATTLADLIPKLEKTPKRYFGFDISISRLLYASQYLSERGYEQHEGLFMADLFEIPMPDSSIDLVYTSHSLEPNGGKELEALQELYRIARRYLVLLEPSYEFGDEEARARMIDHNYVRDLPGHCERLGFDVVEHRRFEVTKNPKNPTGLIVIRKNENTDCSGAREHEKKLGISTFQCPISKQPLRRHENFYYSTRGGYLYPVIKEIPCLLRNTAILASHIESFT
jgi:ubiquinone/menaquinone biosynthesis C-methylase UbiE